jgi:hypothetical protein
MVQKQHNNYYFGNKNNNDVFKYKFIILSSDNIIRDQIVIFLTLH